MLRPRLIPCLLLQNKGVVKTTQFKNPIYVGDPINTVRLFNDKNVDELLILDIDATRKNIEPDYNFIKKLANECRMPLCYGGGIKDLNQINKIINLGIEKVSLSNTAFTNPNLLKTASKYIGSQSIVVTLDIKKTKPFGDYFIFTHNGTKRISRFSKNILKNFEDKGIGEIVINIINRDGRMDGYDYDFISKVRMHTSLPITFLGGAGSLEDIQKLWHKFGIVGAAAGSIFIFKGKYKAVLINYPSIDEKYSLINNAGLNK